jgi:arylsulfatase A-like enzyme
MAHPNILLIMTDQQRFDSLGCYGASWVSTPNLDRLAADGVLFENCYTNNPICTPARASLMTGKEMPAHGVYRLHDVLPEDEIMFTERLRERGYRTALFGKLHVSGRVEEARRRHPHDGFDVYEWCLEPAVDIDSPLNGYTKWLRENYPAFLKLLREKRRHRGHDPEEVTMGRWAADRAIDFIRGADPDTPFFCTMSLFDPHNPYDNYPREWEKYVDAAKIPASVPPGGEADGPVPYAFTAEREHSYLGPMESFSPEDILRMRLGYYAMIAGADREVGRVFAALDEKGLTENTLVVFTSDHGDMLGDHATLVKGAMLHDPCTRVPLIVRFPAAFGNSTPVGGRRLAALVQLHDLAATFLAAAGCGAGEIAAWMPDSRDLRPLAAGKTGAAHEFVVCPYRNSGIDDTGRNWDPPINTTMVREGRWKLHAYHPVPGRQEGPIYLLFDMETDPREMQDLSRDPKHGPVLEKLKDRLVGWLLKSDLARGGRGGEAVPAKNGLIINAIK